jgi:hypothetical protein
LMFANSRLKIMSRDSALSHHHNCFSLTIAAKTLFPWERSGGKRLKTNCAHLSNLIKFGSL